ncbi:MAG TPA: hypothetical protein DCP91_08340 [Eggerthellaceae bacterium]|nr:hypothetical protein [Eggerthellaceae bacterium]
MVAIVVVCALVVAGFFAWNRWLRYDDHADMQGQWYVVGTIVPVTIEEGGIRLTDDVSYEYSIDEHDKTIQFSFGPMKGQGNYCFSDDRQYLVITDGNEYSAATMSAEELVRTFRDLVAASEGASTSMSGKLGITALRRIPSPIAKIMKEAEAQAEAARKAAEERAKREAEEQAAREAAEEQAAAQAAAEAAAQETAGSYYYYYPEDATAADAGAAYYDTGAYADYYVDASAYGYEETYAGEAAY